MSSSTSPSSDHPFTIEVAPDKLSAVVKLTAASLRKCTAAEIMERLKRSEMKLCDGLQERVEAMFKSPPRGHPPALQLAVGAPPINDTPATLVLTQQPDLGPALAKAGDTVAKVDPVKPGQDGLDVYGKPVARCVHSTEPSHVAGAGVSLSKDRSCYLATVDGIVQVVGNEVRVEPASTHSTASSIAGKISTNNSVIIQNNVEDTGEIEAGGSVMIHGIADAGSIRAGRDVFCRGGIALREKGRIVAGRNLQARFVSGGTVNLGADLVISGELTHCTLECGGSVTADAIYGGRLTANGGIRCQSLGSQSMGKTIVEVGFHADVRRFAEVHLDDLRTRKKKVQRTRDIVGPLLQNQRHLTPSQKERATELLYEAQTVLDDIEQSLQPIRQIAADAERRRCETVNVAQNLYPGVTLRFAGIEATVRLPIAGPMQIVAKTEHGRRSVVVIEEKTGNQRMLESRPIADDPVIAMHELLNTPLDKPTAAATAKAA